MKPSTEKCSEKRAPARKKVYKYMEIILEKSGQFQLATSMNSYCSEQLINNASDCDFCN